MNMKRSLLTALVLIIIVSAFADVSYTVLNEFQTITRDIGDEYKNYFSDKLQLQIFYNNLSVGAKYNYYKPKYDRFSSVEMAGNEEDENYFDEYFLQFESDHFFLKAGTYDAVIGSGMVMHNYYDTDFEDDSRLTGGYAQAFFDKVQAQIFYGLMKSASDENENDEIGAVDADFNLLDNLTFGGGYIIHMQHTKELPSDPFIINERHIFTGRINYFNDIFDLNAEYAKSSDDNDVNGTGIYSNATAYLGKFTLLTAYKKYKNFDTKITDLPMANHSEQQLEHGWEPGKDEEGLMGEIRFLPNYENEFVINYAEGWNSNFKVRQSDLYCEFKHDFENLSIKAEYSALEQINTESGNNWYKELTPAMSFDFMLKKMPIMIKGEYQYKEEDNGAENISHFEPRLQTDIAIGNYSASITVENQLGESEDGDDGEFWIGGELAVSIFGNTDVRVFVGKEKGGLVCRNGVCNYQTEFKGLRLNIISRF